MDSQAAFNCLFPRAEIAAAVSRLASEISRDYRSKNPLLVGILKGSFVFMADLVRLLDFPLEVEFARLASYGAEKRTSGRVRVVQGIGSPVKGRDVLVVEDIVDTGLTAAFLLEYLRKRQPASLRLCALADKPSRRRVQVAPDYTGFTVPDRFLVGYGLGSGDRYRHLPDICYLEE
jgi:hypoxanthine phosphoribosyltransferase